MSSEIIYLWHRFRLTVCVYVFGLWARYQQTTKRYVDGVLVLPDIQERDAKTGMHVYKPRILKWAGRPTDYLKPINWQAKLIHSVWREMNSVAPRFKPAKIVEYGCLDPVIGPEALGGRKPMLTPIDGIKLLHDRKAA